MNSVLDQLRDMTVVVADTGETDAVRKHKPVDCTTNPSLILAALKGDGTNELIEQDVARAKSNGYDAAKLCDILTVSLGAELAKLVPGRVSTEVDAILSFDTNASIRRAMDIIADYDNRGVGHDRVLIKLAATWEGIRASEQLQKEGIDCNLTLIFSIEQAIACANAGAFLISPFVGRITDWYKKAQGVDHFAPDEDPGVLSVRNIYDYYKSNGIATVVMGASFRNVDQIKALAGCDRLTIAPSLLEALGAEKAVLRRALSSETAQAINTKPQDQTSFLWGMNADAMATEKLGEGIRNFDAGHQKLLEILARRL